MPDKELLTLTDRVIEVGKWIPGALAVLCTWIWKMSKDHSRVAAIESEISRLKEDQEKLEQSQEEFLTMEQHRLLQRECQEHVARVQGEKLHAAILVMKADNAVMREDMSIMNANICKLLGKFEVEPIQGRDKRRWSDVPQGTEI